VVDLEGRYTINNNSSSLLIVVGDSWSYGDSLDNRFDECYASVLANRLNYNLVNCSMCGISNAEILDRLAYELSNINYNNYDNVLIIITLTETGREWDRYHVESNKIDDLLKTIEQATVNTLDFLTKSVPSNTSVLVGRNFTNYYLETALPDNFLKKNWCEIISVHSGVSFPFTPGPVTGRVFDHMIDEYKDPTFKEWMLSKMDQVVPTWKWLEQSPYNHKKASKHPTAQGHIFWADYLMSNFKQ